MPLNRAAALRGLQAPRSPLSLVRSSQDVGSGAGQVAAELALPCPHHIASDNDEDHLTVTERRVAPNFDSSRLFWTHSRGEDLAKRYPGASADIIVAAEAMVLMDSTEGSCSFTKLLKPGGRLASWFYGGPTFSDPESLARG